MPVRGMASWNDLMGKLMSLSIFSAIQGEGFRSLEEGEPVEFSVARTDKGLQAENVSKLG